ncbi:MAG: hypothetical protein LBC74_05740 [Planctomycetaceae bacterium]|nr:hypothetical protein [Planctomycetaceae bacterium]
MHAKFYILYLFSNLKIHQHNKKHTTKTAFNSSETTPLTPPNEGNNSPPSEGSEVVSYRLAKWSIDRAINCVIQKRQSLLSYR